MSRPGNFRRALKGLNVLFELSVLLRGLVRSPAYATIAAGTLGLAIGLNTAIFSMVSLFIFEQFPMKDTDGLAYIRGSNPQQGLQFLGISAADFLEYRRETTVFEQLAATDRTVSYVLDAGGEPLRIKGYAVSANLLSIWGIEPELGRDFALEEDKPGAPDVAILGYGFWERQFASDPGIVGSSLRLDGRETTVIGVMNREIEFGFYATVDVWTPLKLDSLAASGRTPTILPEGRLKEGRTLAEAREEIGRIAADIKQRHPASHAGLEVTALGWDETLSSPEGLMVILLLAVTVGCVMLIACANVSTLMLARASVRARENALRMALGAGGRRIAALMVGEAALLALLAVGLGLLLTSWMHSLLMWVSGDQGGFTLVLRSAEVDWRVLMLTLSIGLVAPLLSALPPIIYTFRLRLETALNATGRSAVAGGGLFMRRIMVVTQISLALALMTAAGVLLRSMIDLRSQELGFAADRTLTLHIELPADRYPDDARIAQFFDEAGERIRALPDVLGAAWTSSKPLMPAGWRTNFSIADRVHAPEQVPWAAVQIVDPGYHELLEIRLLQGRALNASDAPGSRRAAVVSRRVAQQYWPGTSPVGETIRLDGGETDEPPIEIVGVVADVYSGDPRQPATPILYFQRSQYPRPAMDLVIRSRRDQATALAPLVRRQIWDLDAGLPVDRVATIHELQRDLLSGFGVLSTLLGIFAGFSMLMAAAGIYGVTAFSVEQRRREIGLRMALGAVAHDVRKMVVGQMLALTSIGIGIGLLAAVLLNRVLQAGLSEVGAGDPITYLAVAAVLMIVALLAAYRPVHAASTLDPIEALREE